jgi:hypothetical protein
MSEIKTPEIAAAPPSAKFEDFPGSHHLYVASSGMLGFIGAFTDLTRVKTQVREKYPNSAIIVHKFPLVKTGDASPNTVWLVLSNANDAVLFASNQRSLAEAVKERYATVNLTHPDSLDYWAQPINALQRDAEIRMAAVERGVQMYAGAANEAEFQSRLTALGEESRRATEAMLDQIERAGAGRGALEAVIEANESISLADCIVTTGEVVIEATAVEATSAECKKAANLPTDTAAAAVAAAHIAEPNMTVATAAAAADETAVAATAVAASAGTVAPSGPSGGVPSSEPTSL